MPTVMVNGVRLGYEISGDGDETLVLVNGLADTKETWELQLAAFSERYRGVPAQERASDRGRESGTEALALVIARDREGFSVGLIPYTQEHTNLMNLQPGDRVNLESDIIARYIEQLLEDRSSDGDPAAGERH